MCIYVRVYAVQVFRQQELRNNPEVQWERVRARVVQEEQLLDRTADAYGSGATSSRV